MEGGREGGSVCCPLAITSPFSNSRGGQRSTDDRQVHPKMGAKRERKRKRKREETPKKRKSRRCQNISIFGSATQPLSLTSETRINPTTLPKNLQGFRLQPNEGLLAKCLLRVLPLRAGLPRRTLCPPLRPSSFLPPLPLT